MTWVILTGRQSDLDQVASPHKTITNKDYLTHPGLFRGQRPKIINLSNNYGYQSRGYYASLLASSRGHRVIPSVETIIDLSEHKLYENALPELELALNKCRKDLGGTFPAREAFFFGVGPSRSWDRFSRLLFDWFRAPSLEVAIRDDGQWAAIRKIAFLPVNRLSDEQKERFLASLDLYTRREWRDSKARTPSRYSFATLVNPQEQLAPSSIASLRHWSKIAEKMGVEVEPITRKDLAKLANYDALFIRETTTLKDHTYRFAMLAEAEGMPVIDDVTSILRCTNKVYLAELLHANNLPAPKTLIINRNNVLDCETRLGYPVVLKIPDGSFSRGVHRVADREELLATSKELFRKSDLILAQEYMYTKFDWRVGVLNRKPLFVSQYFMSRRHWQIVNHTADGRHVEGDFKTMAVEDAPKEVVEAALRAAGLIGDGLYGVDLKQTKDGVFVIEINDNPNLDRGVEDVVLKDDLYRIVLGEFIQRIEHR